MPRLTEATIHEQLSEFLAEQIGLRDFRLLLVDASWGSDREVDSHARDLANQINLVLDEYADDLWTKEELRDQLLGISGHPLHGVASFPDHRNSIMTIVESGYRINRVHEWNLTSADTELAAASGS